MQCKSLTISNLPPPQSILTDSLIVYKAVFLVLGYSDPLPKDATMNTVHKRMQQYSMNIKSKATKHRSLSTQPNRLPSFFGKCCLQQHDVLYSVK